MVIISSNEISLRGGVGGMVTDFSGISSNEFVVICRASTDNLGILLGLCAPNVAHVATGGKKWLKKLKSEQNDIELVSFR